MAARRHVQTDAGAAIVQAAGGDRFLVFIAAEAARGGFTVAAEIFMPEPGEFIDVTPEGHQSVVVLPRSALGAFPDAAVAAAELDVRGLPPADPFPTIEEEAALRGAALQAAERAYCELQEREEFDPPDAAPSTTLH